MRVLTTSLIAVFAAVAIASCSSSNSGSSGSTGASASTAPADNGAASSAPATTGELPSYPGATTEAAASNMTGAMGTASGKVLSTTDSFDTVYKWYQKNMPAGSEKSHMDTPVQSAVFMTGEMGKDQQSVTISVAGGKTMITIAHVKS